MRPASEKVYVSPPGTSHPELRAVRDGAGLDVARVYEDCFDFVWTSLRRLGVADADLDDASQQVFVVVHRRADALHEDVSVRAWLFGIVRRIAHRHRRGLARRGRLHDAIASEPRPTSDPEATLSAREAVQLVDDFLERLDERKREVFVLAELEQLSGKEIAAMLAIPHDTVWSRLRAARAAFERHFARVRGEFRRSIDPTAERTRVLVDARHAHAAPAQARQRVAALVALRLADPTAVAPLGGLAWPAITKLHVFAVTLALGTTAIVGVRASMPTRAAIEPTSVVAVTPEPTQDPGPERSAALVPARADPPVVVLPDPPALAPSTSAVRPSSVDTAARASVSRETTLREEVAWIDRVRAANETGDHESALRLADEHARRFPTGDLSAERAALRVVALCGLGRTTEAAAEVEGLARTRPDSPVPKRLATGCPAIVPTKTAAAGDG